MSKQVVEETFVRESNELVHITANGETISSTPDHPFYVPQKGFVRAINLRAGDILWTVDGEYVVVEKVQHEILESPVKVFNFRVADNHTYFVGNASIGVHNAYCIQNGQLPNQGVIRGDVEGAPGVDAGKQGKHVIGHNNYNSKKSTWVEGSNGVTETQEAWIKGTPAKNGTRVYETGKVVGTQGETGVRVHMDGNGYIHGYPVNVSEYIK